MLRHLNTVVHSASHSEPVPRSSHMNRFLTLLYLAAHHGSSGRVKSGQEPECRLSGGDCGLMMVLVGAECEPKTSLACGSECHCLQAASATCGRIGQVSEPTRSGKHRTPVSILPGCRGNPWVSSRQQTQKDSRQPQPKSMPRKVGIELNASEALVEAS
jgi:hypothetical protein